MAEASSIHRSRYHLRLYQDVVEGKYQPANPQMNVEEAEKAIAELEQLDDYVSQLEEMVLSALGWYLSDANSLGQYTLYDEGMRIIDRYPSKSLDAAQRKAMDYARKIMTEWGMYDG